MRMICVGLVLAAALSGPAVAELQNVVMGGTDITFDQALIDALKGDDDAARARARQLLPREGVWVVSKLVPLCSDERPEVSWAAYAVLADFANEASVLGREQERTEVARELVALIAPERSPSVKAWGLELLTIAAPEGMDLGPIAALLKDPDLRERARSALELMNTKVSRAALRNALKDADPAFQCALLDSLGKLRDAESVSLARGLTQSSDARVRASALRALAWTGDPQYLPVARSVATSATNDTRAEAIDAALRLADALVLKGHAREGLMAYKAVLTAVDDPALRGAAVSGLIRSGDASVVPDVLAALSGNGGAELQPSVLSAVEYADSQASVQLVQALYAQLPAEMRAACLGAMGRKGSPAYLDELKAATTDGDLAVRLAAIDGLVASRLSEAIPVLEALAAGQAADERFAARNGLLKMAEDFQYRGDTEDAGRAYLAVYRAPDSSITRKAALEGIARNPSPEALDVLVASVKRGEMQSLPMAEIGALYKAMAASGRGDDAKRLLDTLLAGINTTDGVRALIATAGGSGDLPDLSRRLGFVTVWKVAGPFPWTRGEGFGKTYVNESNVDLSATYEGIGGQIGWKPFETKDPSGVVDFSQFFGPRDDASAYAVATVNVAADTDVVVRTGSDDGIKVWVNGAAVQEVNADRGSDIDQEQAPAKLKAGDNTILVRVTQGGGGWNCRVRLTTPDGAPLAFTQP